MIIEKDRVALWLYEDDAGVPIISTVDHGPIKGAPKGRIYMKAGGPFFVGDDDLLRLGHAKVEKKDAADQS